MFSVEKFTNSYLYISLIFGVFLYDFIGKNFGFTYTDELLMAVLLVYGIKYGQYGKEAKLVLILFVFYVIYSLLWGVACKEAIFTDVLIFMKPFVGLYVSIGMGLTLDDIDKERIRKLVIVLFVISLGFCAISYNYFASDFMGHPSRIATLFQILGVTYFYCSERTKRDIIITMVIFCCSLLSFRSKSYAFVAAAFFIIFYLNASRLERFSLSGLIIILLGVSMMFMVAWEKFYFYFVTGSNSELSASFARPALYQGAFWIMNDYFPFGSGFGSYACYASGLYYSPIYYQYGLDVVQGLDEYEGAFISDTFFPQIAQFGVVGLFLFILFFVIRYKEIVRNSTINNDVLLMKMSILILLFFLIESSVDSTFVHNRGMVMMMLWGMLINESNEKTYMS